MKKIYLSDLKRILHSKQVNLYYLEHCRISVSGDQVEYVTEERNQSLYWNIPIANTTTVLLGTGTSLTQAAMREFAKAGVLVGFCGGGGKPLFTANEIVVAVSWFNLQNKGCSTKYLQQQVNFWFNDKERLQQLSRFNESVLLRSKSRGWMRVLKYCINLALRLIRVGWSLFYLIFLHG